MRNRHREISMAIVFTLSALTTSLCAAEEGTKGTDARRHLEVHPVGAVHKMGDWFATRHVPKEQRHSAMEQRRTEREVQQAEDKVKRDQRREEKQAIFDADKTSRVK